MGAISAMLDGWAAIHGNSSPVQPGAEERVEIHTRYKAKWQRNLNLQR